MLRVVEVRAVILTLRGGPVTAASTDETIVDITCQFSQEY